VTLTPAQCKGAREMLGWTLLDLGYRSRTSEKTVSRFETNRCVTRADNVEAMRRTLEAAGVAFDGEGRVTLRK
jgi:transcriptional regulator with XRE-family HTH domain